MAQEWRELLEKRTRTSKTKRLHIDGQPTNKYMWDGQVGPSSPLNRGFGPGTFADIDPQPAQVGAGADDGRITGINFNATATENYFGYIYGAHYHGWARWTGITIEGTIDVSYVEFYCSTTGSPNLNVYGVDEDNPAAPTNAGQFNGDPLTTAFSPWDGAWGAGWNQSPSLNGIFQELVDTYTISNDAVMVQVKDDSASSGIGWRPYEYDTALAPKLHIEYTAAGGGVEVAPDPAFAIAGITAPGVVQSSMSVTPSALTAIATKIDPTVVLGSMTLIPAAISGIASRDGPTVVLGSLSLSPATSSAIAASVNPTTIQGSIALVMTPSSVVGTGIDPTAILGSILITPSVSSGVGAVTTPIVVQSSMSITPTASGAVGAKVDPTTIQGSITLMPSWASTVGGGANPTIILGSVTIIASAGGVVAITIDPTVAVSGEAVIAAASFGGWGWGWREGDA